jgi:hypothetical protein
VTKMILFTLCSQFLDTKITVSDSYWCHIVKEIRCFWKAVALYVGTMKISIHSYNLAPVVVSGYSVIFFLTFTFFFIILCHQFLQRDILAVQVSVYKVQDH